MVSTQQIGELVLGGCTPDPLMSYLKALGVFRLVAEQKEAGVRASWRNDEMVLHTSLGRNDLKRFFLEEYRPTPIVAPWNGGSGFYEKDNIRAMRAILESEDQRLATYRDIIELTQELVARMSSSQKKDAKEAILRECRNILPDDVLPWLDAAYVLSGASPKYPPLLGTGGNDGRLEFSNNFMQNMILAFDAGAGTAKSRSRRRGTPQEPSEILEAALFGDISPSLSKRTTGQFAPGSVGGPNATVGFEGEALTNPWGYVLMIEGALLFAGAAARRLSAASHAKAVFPFTVDTSAAGYGTATDAEYGDAARSEVWIPLWEQPATYREVAHVVSEGRAQLGQRQAATGVDFARAVAGLGVERGLSEFVRFGLFMRSGRAYLATPLGRFRVRANPAVDVLTDIDEWLRQLRRHTRGQNAPEGLNRALRGIDQAIIEFCQVREVGQDTARALQNVLAALGRAESWVALSRLRDSVRPLADMRGQWVSQADDQSPEFRIAAAVASIQGSGDRSIGPVRCNLEAVDFGRRGPQFGKDNSNPSTVWTGYDPLRDMVAVLERRCLEAQMHAAEGDVVLPLEGRVQPLLSDILLFLEGRLDYSRIADLVLPLSAVSWTELHGDVFAAERRNGEDAALLPLPYAVLKLVFLPRKLRRPGDEDGVTIKPEPSILPLLRAGRATDAYNLAWRRLHVSGITPLTRKGQVAVPAQLALRLAAALLIPIRHTDVPTLDRTALVQPNDNG